MRNALSDPVAPVREDKTLRHIVPKATGWINSKTRNPTTRPDPRLAPGLEPLFKANKHPSQALAGLRLWVRPKQRSTHSPHAPAACHQHQLENRLILAAFPRGERANQALSWTAVCLDAIEAGAAAPRHEAPCAALDPKRPGAPDRPQQRLVAA